MIIELPLFNKLEIRKFQGIDSKSLEFNEGITSLFFKPMSGKSSFLNSLIFLYYGDIRYLDNYQMFGNLKYDEILTLVFNNQAKSFDELVIRNDYLHLSGTTDTSILSETDKKLTDEYIVKCVFKRTLDVEKLLEFLPDGGEKCFKKKLVDLQEVDYSYICYEENKSCSETRFRDISNFFIDQTNAVQGIEVYNYIRNLVRKVSDIEVLISDTTSLTLVKNGRVIYTPPSTIQYLVNLVILLTKPANTIIFCDDFISKFDVKTMGEIISELTQIMYSLNFKKKIVFISNMSEKDKWLNVLQDSNIMDF